MQKQKFLLPVLALVTANVLWGFNTVFIKISLETIPVAISVGARMVLASLCLLPLAIKTWKPLKKPDLFRFFLSSVFVVALCALSLNIGLTKTSASSSAVILLVEPILLLVLSASFLKEKIGLHTFIGILVAITGSMIIIGKPISGNDTADVLIGNLFIFMSIVFSAVAILISKPLMKKASSYQATFLTLFPGAVIVLTYALFNFKGWDPRTVSSSSAQAFFISTIIVLFANVFFYWALKRKEAHTTGVYSYITPVVTVTAAWFILSERPDIEFVLGAVLILIGVYLAEIHTKLKRPLARPS